MGLVRHCGRQVAEEGLQETILPGIGGFADCSIGELMLAIALWDGARRSFGMGWSRSNRPILQSAKPPTRSLNRSLGWGRYDSARDVGTHEENAITGGLSALPAATAAAEPQRKDVAM